MFDEFTFALRYDPEVRITLCGVTYAIPIPITQEIIDHLKAYRVWESFEPIIGPYVAIGE